MNTTIMLAFIVNRGFEKINESYWDLRNSSITIKEHSSHKPNVILVLFPVSSGLPVIVQLFLGISFLHFGHFVMNYSPSDNRFDNYARLY